MGQESGKLSTRNPLDEIRDELVEVLRAADVPFTEEQTGALLSSSRSLGAHRSNFSARRWISAMVRHKASNWIGRAPESNG